MAIQYSPNDYKFLLNKAILEGDNEAERAVIDLMANEYEETMIAQEIMDEIDGDK